jgi:hypothetical protein
MGVRCAGTVGGTWLLWVRRSTARAAGSASGVQRPLHERADGQCAELALRAHQSCKTVRGPALQVLATGLCACGRRGLGSVGSAPSARHVGGCMSGASSGGVAAAGLLRYSQRGPRARLVTREYSKGHPILWVRCAGTVGGTWLLWVRRSTARAAGSASGVQRPRP